MCLHKITRSKNASTLEEQITRIIDEESDVDMYKKVIKDTIIFVLSSIVFLYLLSIIVKVLFI